ncbi:MAG: MFS transporter [Proteobacteria bacterium]|nr:MFS transporter [Pseudomonadota bacterium]
MTGRNAAASGALGGRVLAVLATAQLIGWGTVGLLAVVGGSIAADLRIDLATVFAGNAVFYVTMGLCGPLLAGVFVRHGARRVMAAGTLVSAAGFAALAGVHGPAAYFLSWAVLGAGGSATLSTAANIALNEIAGRNARSAIGLLMVITGLSSSIFWPFAAVLAAHLGWRGTCALYAVALAAVCLPLYAFGLPRPPAPQDQRADPVHGDGGSAPGVVGTAVFPLIVTAIALNAFVTVGLSALLIELLKSKGLPPTEAIAFASILGVVQVSARAADFLGGARWDGLNTGLVAGIGIPVSLSFLAAAGAGYWTIAVFILLYGVSSGAFAVARATIPLVFFDSAAYARAASKLALPLNVMSAVAAPILAGLLTRLGSNALLGVVIACSSAAAVTLLRLSRRRPVRDMVPS